MSMPACQLITIHAERTGAVILYSGVSTSNTTVQNSATVQRSLRTILRSKRGQHKAKVWIIIATKRLIEKIVVGTIADDLKRRESRDMKAVNEYLLRSTH